MSYFEKYQQLSEPQKFSLRRKYMADFGGKATFYNKIRGAVRMLRAEILFFESNLTTSAAKC